MAFITAATQFIRTMNGEIIVRYFKYMFISDSTWNVRDSSRQYFTIVVKRDALLNEEL